MMIMMLMIHDDDYDDDNDDDDDDDVDDDDNIFLKLWFHVIHLLTSIMCLTWISKVQLGCQG